MKSFNLDFLIFVDLKITIWHLEHLEADSDICVLFPNEMVADRIKFRQKLAAWKKEVCSLIPIIS